MCVCVWVCCDNTVSDNLALRNRSVNIGRLFVKANSRVCLWSIGLWLLKHLHWTKKLGESRPRVGTTTKSLGSVWWRRDDDLEILRFCINRIKREAWESEGSRNRNMRIVERELALPSFERNAREGFSWRGTRQGPRQSRQRMFQQRKVRLCPLSDELDRITSRQTVSQTDSRK